MADQGYDMSGIRTVALAGVGNSGSIGGAILDAFLATEFLVTVLTRVGSVHKFPASVKVIEVDYDDEQSLIHALQDQDALICAFGFSAILKQEKLIDAAITTGIKRIIPSEFGSDPENSMARKLPVFAQKVQIENYVKEKIKGSSTTYTLICNNEFIDWDLSNNWNVDVKARKIKIFDEGETSYTATPVTFVAKGVVHVLQHAEETANRVVRLHGISLTQNKLFKILQKATGSTERDWTVSRADTAETEKQAYVALQKAPDNFYGWGVPFLECAVWAKGYGGDLSDINDNKLLGLQELGESDIEETAKKQL